MSSGNVYVDAILQMSSIPPKDDFKYDTRHGGPWDRGGADSYYRRAFNPHYYKGGTGDGLVEAKDMTPEEIEAYTAGFNENEESKSFKDWG